MSGVKFHRGEFPKTSDGAITLAVASCGDRETMICPAHTVGVPCARTAQNDAARSRGFHRRARPPQIAPECPRAVLRSDQRSGTPTAPMLPIGPVSALLCCLACPVSAARRPGHAIALVLVV
ncbi:MAG: hypothetical protein ACYTDW_09360 [Planctomycetota bacterium]